MTEVDAHLDETWFSWFGGTGDEDPFYYRIHSPVVLIEFDFEGEGAVDFLNYVCVNNVDVPVGRSVYTPLFSGVYWDTLDYILPDLDRLRERIVRPLAGAPRVTLGPDRIVGRARPSHLKVSVGYLAGYAAALAAVGDLVAVALLGQKELPVVGEVQLARAAADPHERGTGLDEVAGRIRQRRTQDRARHGRAVREADAGEVLVDVVMRINDACPV